MLRQHVRAVHETEDEERAEQDRHRGASRHPERDRRNQRAAFLRIVRRARTEHAAHVAGAEALALLGGARALGGVAVGHPLRDRAAHAGHDADEGPDQAAADGQPEVAEGILHALERALADATRGQRAGDRGAAHREIDDLGNGKNPDQHRHELEPVPQVKHVEGVAGDASLRVLSHSGAEQPERAGEELQHLREIALVGDRELHLVPDVWEQRPGIVVHCRGQHMGVGEFDDPAAGVLGRQILAAELPERGVEVADVDDVRVREIQPDAEADQEA